MCGFHFRIWHFIVLCAIIFDYHDYTITKVLLNPKTMPLQDQLTNELHRCTEAMNQ